MKSCKNCFSSVAINYLKDIEETYCMKDEKMVSDTTIAETCRSFAGSDDKGRVFAGEEASGEA